MIGGTPATAIPNPLIMPTNGAGAEQQRHGPKQRLVLTVREQGNEYRGAVQHPRHRKVDSAADNDEGLAKRDDTDKRGKHAQASKVSASQESRRDQTGKQEKSDGSEIGDENAAMPGEVIHHKRFRRADFSAIELASTATSKMMPDAMGCQ